IVRTDQVRDLGATVLPDQPVRVPFVARAGEDAEGIGDEVGRRELAVVGKAVVACELVAADEALVLPAPVSHARTLALVGQLGGRRRMQRIAAAREQVVISGGEGVEPPLFIATVAAPAVALDTEATGDTPAFRVVLSGDA